MDFPALRSRLGQHGSCSAHVRELLLMFQQTVRADDLIQLLQGTLFNENVLNLYYKILEKINLVLLTAYAYLKAKTPSGETEDGLTEEPPLPLCDKVLYLNSNFMRRVRSRPLNFEQQTAAAIGAPGTAAKGELASQLGKVFEADVVIVPFFFDEPFSRTVQTVMTAKSGRSDNEAGLASFKDISGTVLVSIRPHTLEIDLFTNAARDSDATDDDTDERSKFAPEK